MSGSLTAVMPSLCSTFWIYRVPCRICSGVVGGHGIEIGGGDIASFSELALIPARASDPFAGLDQRDLGLYSRHDFRYRSGIRKLHAVKFFHASLGNVRVRINKPRRGRVPVKVDDPHPGSTAREF